jgi:hypothetical protein
MQDEGSQWLRGVAAPRLADALQIAVVKREPEGVAEIGERPLRGMIY